MRLSLGGPYDASWLVAHSKKPVSKPDLAPPTKYKSHTHVPFLLRPGHKCKAQSLIDVLFRPQDQNSINRVQQGAIVLLRVFECVCSVSKKRMSPQPITHQTLWLSTSATRPRHLSFCYLFILIELLEQANYKAAHNSSHRLDAVTANERAIDFCPRSQQQRRMSSTAHACLKPSGCIAGAMRCLANFTECTQDSRKKWSHTSKCHGW